MNAHISDHDLLYLVDGSVESMDVHDDRLVEHLERCVACQDRLASLSGEGEWLTELKQVLDMESIEIDCEPVPSSVSVVLDGTQNDERIDATHVRLDFLESPRHPELLGRLGRYDIERLVGVGGFGIVFKAHDSELHRTVALKVLSPHLMSSGAARQRFAREAQAAAAIHHENVIPIFDVMAEEQVVYLVMPFIAGSSLQERVDRDGPLSVDEILRIGAQMAAGLAAAHKQAVVHRDVKPANVLLESSLDRVLISDFGLARTADDASLTRSGVITGTPHYMSPEQATGEAMDARSDLFSLGSVLYFMCTGHPPFRAPQVLAVLNQISRKEPRPIESFRKDIPFQLQALINRLLKKSPARRFACASDVCNELTQLLNAYQKGRLRSRKPTISRQATIVLLTLLALLMAAPVGFGIYNNNSADPITNSDSNQEFTGGVDNDDTNSASAAAGPLRNDSNNVQGVDLDDSFDEVASEADAVVLTAESEQASPNGISPSVDSVWTQTLEAVETQLEEAETLFSQPQHIPPIEFQEKLK